jgi:hypothetical protein
MKRVFPEKQEDPSLSLLEARGEQGERSSTAGVSSTSRWSCKRSIHLLLVLLVLTEKKQELAYSSSPGRAVFLVRLPLAPF